MATTTSSPPSSPPQSQSPNPSPPSNPNFSQKPLHLQMATAAVASSPPPKKPQSLPWTHQETLNLIQAYQEKWYSLKRGQLKASQWEEVAVTVAARCGYDEPSKSATQCRHKIEKLRKRYRAEKQRPYPIYWQYFDLLDAMSRGPMPISAQPLTTMPHYRRNSHSSDDDDEEDIVDEFIGHRDRTGKRNKSRSVNHILRGCGRDGIQNSRVFQSPMLQKRKECIQSDGGSDDDEDDDDMEEEQEEEEEGEEVEGREVVAELAVEIRAFAERFVRMENKKIEMMRETQRLRMEMEKRRMGMILESQQKIVETIGRAFGSHKKLKMSQEF